MFNNNIIAYEQQLHEIGITDNNEQKMVLDFLKSLVTIVLTQKFINNE